MERTIHDRIRDRLDPPLTGQTVAGYAIGPSIGSGAIGRVYKAAHVRDGHVAAFKVIRPEWINHAAMVARFEREGRLTLQLTHPNTTRVYASGRTSDGRLYIVQELLEGRTLLSALRGYRRLAPRRAAIVARQIAASLAEAHLHGVVHRDISARNVFLVRDAQGLEMVKVLDFGLAVAPEDLEGRVTMPGEVLGTPEYMSPEQSQGMLVDARSDLYSLGILMYQMLAGKLPFQGSQFMLIIRHVREEPPPLPPDVREQLPAELNTLLFRMLAKNPDDRPASADEVMETLGRLIPALSVDAPSSRRIPPLLTETMPVARRAGGSVP